MVKISSLVIAYILFPEQEIPDQRKKETEEVITLLTGTDEYWEISDDAKWIPWTRANMELVIRNIFLDFPAFQNPEEFLAKYPVEVFVNLEQKPISSEEIRHLIENEWTTYLGLIE